MNPYLVLGIKPAATPEQVEKAYRRMAKRYHPDRNVGDAEAAAKYSQVDEAYRILSDPGLRAEYDRTGEAPRFKAAPADPASAELFAALEPLLVMALQTVRDRGTYKQADLAKHVLDLVTEQMRQAEEFRGKVQRTLDVLRYVTGRFAIPDGGENVPESIVRRQLAMTEAEHVRITAELDKLTRLKVYLKGVKYSSGGGAGNLVRGATSSYAADYAVRFWGYSG